MRISKFFVVAVITLFMHTQCNMKKDAEQSISTQNDSLQKVFHNEFNRLMQAWYPISIDLKYGGFYSDFSFDWIPDGAQQKMVVQQARHVWTCSQAFMYTKDSAYLKIAKHGYDFLRNKMWDTEFGGFYTILDSTGNLMSESYSDEKRVYGNTFAIYGLTAYYNATKDTSALNLAMKTFMWLEKHSHDNENKGYFDLMTREGNLWEKANFVSKTNDNLRRNWKDQNSSIHVLESLTELYKSTKDSLVRVRLEEMLVLVRDVFIGRNDYLTLHFTSNWEPISFRDSTSAIRTENNYFDHVSFGHDVETAFLLLEAEDALEIGCVKSSRNFSITKTIDVAQRLVDHTLENSWDSEFGGIFYEGYYFKNSTKLTVINKEKCWWAQAEMLNALLLMSKKFPAQSKYREAFIKEWTYIDKYLIDKTNKGWYFVGLDYRPEEFKNPKASFWKVNYHDGRALLQCIQMLKQ